MSCHRSAGLALVVMLLCSTTGVAVPALNKPFSLSQPDGSAFIAKQGGDERVNWVYTDDLMIVKDKADGYWRYATLGPDGLRPLPARVGIDAVPAQTARLSAVPALIQARALRVAAAAGEPDVARAMSPTAPTDPLLVILVQFSDRSVSTTTGDWVGSVFGTSGKTVRTYYDEVSRNTFHFVAAAENYGTVDDGIVIVTLDYNHPDNGEEGWTDENRQIVRNALIAADPFVNYAAYDTNSDGVVRNSELHVMTVVAGYDHSYSPDYSPSVWPHYWSLYGGVPPPTLDGVEVGRGRYAQVGELQGEHRATIGVLCHELGHCIGLPDLYDTDDSSYGIGLHGLMGFGSWGCVAGEEYGATPVHMCAWSKIEMGFVSPLNVSTSGTYALYASGPHPAIYNCLKIPTWDPEEYFLIENRQLSGYDAGLYFGFQYTSGGTDGGGLVIWHVDVGQGDNRDETHKKVDLEEANEGLVGGSELDTLANWGNRHHYYYQGHVDAFDDTTTPDTCLYSLRSTRIGVSDVSTAGASMMCYVSVPEIYPLVNDTPVLQSAIPQDFSFSILSYDWDAVGVNRLGTSYDVDIMADDDRDLFSPYEESAGPVAGTPDFVASNGHHLGTDTHYARVDGVRSAEYAVEGQWDIPDVGAGTVQSGEALTAGEVVDVFETFLMGARTYKIVVVVTSGTSDIALFKFNPSRASGSRQDHDGTADLNGAGGGESLQFTAPESGNYGIVLTNDNRQACTYDLRIEGIREVTFTDCTAVPNPVAAGGIVSLGNTGGEVKAALTSDTVKIVIGLRNAAGDWVGGDPVVVYSGSPGVEWWQGWFGNPNPAVMSTPMTPGTCYIWVRAVTTTSNAVAIQAFKDAVVAVEDENNKKWGDSLDVQTAHITQIEPSSGPPTTRVQITGRCFGPSAGGVNFHPAGGGVHGWMVEAWSDTLIICRVAPGTAPAAGQVQVLLVTAVPSDNTVPFEVTDPSVIYVDHKDTGPIENGTPAYPFNTIQEGEDAADFLDHVVVLPGTYVENVTMTDTTTLRALTAGTVTVDGNQTGSCIVAASGTIEGLVLVNGSGTQHPTIPSYWHGGGVYVPEGMSVKIKRCVIRDCFKPGSERTLYGGGICALSAEANVLNCLIRGNQAEFGAAYYNRLGTGTLTNVTVSQNSALTLGIGATIHSTSATLNLRNSVVCQNQQNQAAAVRHSGSGGVTVTYSNVWGNGLDYDGLTPGAGCISADPKFAGAGEFHLSAGSPCIDAADGDTAPGKDMEDNARHDDTGTPDTGTGTPTYADMGAYEFQGTTCVLYVQSTPITGVEITGDPPQAGDTTNYAVHLAEGTDVTLTAPETFLDGSDEYVFVRWVVNEASQPRGQTDVTINVSGDTTAEAVYTLRGDFDGDDDIDDVDFAAFKEVYGLSEGEPGWAPNGPIADFDDDADVDFQDFMEFVDQYGT